MEFNEVWLAVQDDRNIERDGAQGGVVENQKGAAAGQRRFIPGIGGSDARFQAG